jgi:hypothetical protein
MASPLSDDWREFLSLLISHRVKYLLIGAHALAVHGQPRFTADLDIFVEASPTNARRIRDVLEAFGFGSVAPSIEELAKPARVFMLGRAPHRIDILTKISGVGFEEAYRARVRVASDAGRLNVIGRKHLIANKRASGRPKDLQDLALLGESARLSKPKRKQGAPKKRKRARGTR